MTTGSFGRDRNSIICTACGAANAPGSRFCERCGTRLPQGPVGSQPTRAMPIPTPPPAAPAPRPTPPTELSAPVPAPARETAEPLPPAREDPPAPPAGTDSPTVTIELQPTRQISRDAPTQSFELPRELRPASDTPAADPPAASPPDAPPSAGDQPTQVGSGWNYRSWTPPPGGAAPPPTGGDAPSEPEQTRETAPAPTTPPAEVTQVIRPAASTGGIPSERVSAPDEPPFTAPTPGPITYPAGSAPAARQGQPYVGGATPGRQGQPYAGGETQISGTPGGGQPAGPPSGGAPPPSGYMANAGQYPAPATGSNNRTLWIVLGVIGGLVLLCIIICLLIVVVAAVGSSNTTGVATSVATATRR